jgi:ABC-2 type transport system permease protein
VLLGFILRNTAGAISALFAILWIVPLFLPPVFPWLATYLPTNATGSLVTAKIGDDMLQPLPALGLMCGYLTLAAFGAAWTLRRRDA